MRSELFSLGCTLSSLAGTNHVDAGCEVFVLLSTAHSQITPPCVSEPWVLVLRRTWSGLDVGWARESVVGAVYRERAFKQCYCEGQKNLLNSNPTIYLLVIYFM